MIARDSSDVCRSYEYGTDDDDAPADPLDAPPYRGALSGAASLGAPLPPGPARTCAWYGTRTGASVDRARRFIAARHRRGRGKGHGRSASGAARWVCYGGVYGKNKDVEGLALSLRGRYASRRWARSMSRSFAETWRESGRTYLPVAALAVHEWLHAQIGRAVRHGEQLVGNAWCSIRTRHRAAAAAAGSDSAGHRARRHGLDAQETSRRGVHQGSVKKARRHRRPPLAHDDIT